MVLSSISSGLAALLAQKSGPGDSGEPPKGGAQNPATGGDAPAKAAPTAIDAATSPLLTELPDSTAPSSRAHRFMMKRGQTPIVKHGPGAIIGLAAGFAFHGAIAPDSPDDTSAFAVHDPRLQFALTFPLAIGTEQAANYLWTETMTRHYHALQQPNVSAHPKASIGRRFAVASRTMVPDALKAMKPIGDTRWAQLKNALGRADKFTLHSIKTLGGMTGMVQAVDLPMRAMFGDNYAGREIMPFGVITGYIIGDAATRKTAIEGGKVVMKQEGIMTRFLSKTLLGRGLTAFGSYVSLPTTTIELGAMANLVGHEDAYRNGLRQEWLLTGEAAAEHRPLLKMANFLGMNLGGGFVANGDANWLAAGFDWIESGLAEYNIIAPSSTLESIRLSTQAKLHVAAKEARPIIRDAIRAALVDVAVNEFLFGEGSLELSGTAFRDMIATGKGLEGIHDIVTSLAQLGTHEYALEVQELFGFEAFLPGATNLPLKLQPAIEFAGGEGSIKHARDVQIYSRLLEVAITLQKGGHTVADALSAEDPKTTTDVMDIQHAPTKNVRNAHQFLHRAQAAGFIDERGNISPHSRNARAYYDALAQMGTDVLEGSATKNARHGIAELRTWFEARISTLENDEGLSFVERRQIVSEGRLLALHDEVSYESLVGEAILDANEEFLAQALTAADPEATEVQVYTNPDGSPVEIDSRFPGIDPNARQAIDRNAQHWRSQAYARLAEAMHTGIDGQEVVTAWNQWIARHNIQQAAMEREVCATMDTAVRELVCDDTNDPPQSSMITPDELAPIFSDVAVITERYAKFARYDNRAMRSRQPFADAEGLLTDTMLATAWSEVLQRHDAFRSAHRDLSISLSKTGENYIDPITPLPVRAHYHKRAQDTLHGTLRSLLNRYHSFAEEHSGSTDPVALDATFDANLTHALRDADNQYLAAQSRQWTITMEQSKRLEQDRGMREVIDKHNASVNLPESDRATAMEQALYNSKAFDASGNIRWSELKPLLVHHLSMDDDLPLSASVEDTLQKQYAQVAHDNPAIAWQNLAPRLATPEMRGYLQAAYNDAPKHSLTRLLITFDGEVRSGLMLTEILAKRRNRPPVAAQPDPIGDYHTYEENSGGTILN